MTKNKPKVIVFSGYGLNCEEETKFAFEEAGGSADIVHINDVIENPKMLDKYQILAMPGGFSYGDDTGSGKAYGNRLRHHLAPALEKFIARDTLMIGICNGFQILTASGILPGGLTYNESARYIDRWVDVKVDSNSPWTLGLDTLSLPIAHGEGKYVLPKEGRPDIAMQYVKGPMCEYQSLPANPNGAEEDIAAVFGAGGRILGMMPHPERGLLFHHRPDWMVQKAHTGKVPKYGDGFKLFKNAIEYFS